MPNIPIVASPILIDRFWIKVRVGPRQSCWEWQGSRTPKGYGNMKVGGRAVAYSHRISWIIHAGPIPDGMIVMHSCDNPPCVNPAHLRLGTMAENTADMLRKGRGTTGERNYSAKLTWEQVDQIRALYRGRGKGPTQQEIADRFGVANSVVSRILTGQIWRRPRSAVSGSKSA